MRNANFRIDVDGRTEPIILRLYEHDPSLCRKEVDLIRMIGRVAPVPEALHAEPGGWEDAPPFALFRYVDGITLHQLKRSGDREAYAQAAESAGVTLAAIGRVTFPKPGWLGPGTLVGPLLADGADPFPRFVDSCVASPNARQRMPPSLCDGVQRLVWEWARPLGELSRKAVLVHGDFGKKNLLVRKTAGRWRIAAVLDWEFAVSGCALADVGHFLRYERASRPLAEPYFSSGYQRGGGTLPENWRELSRLLDLAALCESLTHDDLPDPIARELVELVSDAVEHREPGTL
jgi:aminoglycoside phosphotransferase (APT) family kinase protein